ncbi:uncharacterized protein SCDLUD_000394 [Saccharomycodes ludwigii]|uniref:uncharacterized protein n=1 Tax=Saccharomycodes ludwigii TaxID=36035 RepID=UPI001E8B0A16|nr:hypothetical protein SCDLUD_000394 [Saccharomycodes ludwigii]KAH3902803.1 hypothetical protein SCDLUD_000394 [Saccharomycodes ludwigii]
MSLGSKAAQRLANKTVLITGASSGIGRATALEYCAASNGNIKLSLIARRLERLKELKLIINEKYPQTKVYIEKLDVTETEKIRPFLENLPEDFKDIDILINNAGKALGSDKVGNISQDDIQGMIQTDVIALVNFTQAVLPLFKRKNKGDIVNLDSVAGIDAYPTGSIYCGCKHFVKAFTESLRKELIDTNIRVIEVLPGKVETEFSVVRNHGDELLAKKVYEGMEPLYGEDIADFIVYATSRKPNTVIAEGLIFPTSQASATHNFKR